MICSEKNRHTAICLVIFTFPANHLSNGDFFTTANITTTAANTTTNTNETHTGEKSSQRRC